MKTIKGFPTIKSLVEICNKHGLLTHPIGDYYKYWKAISFSRESQNEIAQQVNQEIMNYFITEFRPANRNLGITGQIKIIQKREDKL